MTSNCFSERYELSVHPPVVTTSRYAIVDHHICGVPAVSTLSNPVLFRYRMSRFQLHFLNRLAAPYTTRVMSSVKSRSFTPACSVNFNTLHCHTPRSVVLWPGCSRVARYSGSSSSVSGTPVLRSRWRLVHIIERVIHV